MKFVYFQLYISKEAITIKKGPPKLEGLVLSQLWDESVRWLNTVSLELLYPFYWS